MKIRVLLVSAAFAGILLVATAGTAGAAGGVGAVTVSNANPTPGSTVAVSSTGWFPGRPVAVALSGTDRVLASVIADASGSVHTRVEVPADAKLRTDVLSVTGTASSGVPQQIVTAAHRSQCEPRARHRCARGHSPSRSPRSPASCCSRA